MRLIIALILLFAQLTVGFLTILRDCILALIRTDNVNTNTHINPEPTHTYD